MQGYNVILLYDEGITHLLLCRRQKEPYKGKLNLIGGKIEPGEAGEDAAYREMFEESGVSRNDAKLVHLMDFTYPLSDCYVEAYAGKLMHKFDVFGDENELVWVDLDRDFFSLEHFAGEGNIGHMIEEVKLHAERIFSPRDDTAPSHFA